MNERQVKLLQLLLKQSDYLTARQLSIYFGVSTKTIYQDVDKINVFLGAHYYSVEKSPRHGIYLALTESQRQEVKAIVRQQFMEIIDEEFSPEHRERLLIRQLFLLDQAVDLFDFADSVFVTEQSIKRDVEQLQKLLKSFNLRIVRQKECLTVQGSEADRRKFIRSYLAKIMMEQTDKLTILTLFFEMKSIESCKKGIEKLSHTYDFKFSESYFWLILLDCLIIHQRWKLNRVLLQRTDTLLRDISHLEVFFFAGELLENILSLPFTEISEFEIEALAYTLLAVGFQIQNQAYTQDLDLATEKLIKQVSRLLELDLLCDEHLRSMLRTHLSSMIFRLRRQMQIQNPALEEIKKQYASLFHLVWLASRDLSQQYHLLIPDGELAFIVIHFQIAIEKISRPLQIVVACQNGVATSELIMSKLRRVFNSSDKVYKLTANEIEKQSLDDVDMIVSAIELPKQKVPVIQVSPIITSEELVMIHRCYEGLVSSNQSVLRALSANPSFNTLGLEELMSNCVIGSTVRNQLECISQLVSVSKIENRTNSQFLTSIYEREKIGSTSIYTGVALPHCDPKWVARSELVFMTLKKPIKWGENWIKVVILIAITEEELNLFKDSLVTLYAVLENKAFIDELATVTDETQLKQRFLEEVRFNVG